MQNAPHAPDKQASLLKFLINPKELEYFYFL